MNDTPAFIAPPCAPMGVASGNPANTDRCARAEEIIGKCIAEWLAEADKLDAEGETKLADAIRAVANGAEAQKNVRLQILRHQTETP